MNGLKAAPCILCIWHIIRTNVDDLFIILHSNINGRDVQRKNVVNNVDKSSLWAQWQHGPFKNTQNITKYGVYKDATDSKK